MSQLVRALSGRRRAQRRSAYDAATRAPVPPSADASATAETFLFQLSPAALRGAPAGVRRVALSLYSAAGDLLQATPSREVSPDGKVDYAAQGASLHLVSEMRRRAAPAGAALAGAHVKIKLQAVDEGRRALRTFAKLQLDLAQYAAVRRTAHFVEVPLMIYPAFRGRESGAEQALLSMRVMCASLTSATSSVWDLSAVADEPHAAVGGVSFEASVDGAAVRGAASATHGAAAAHLASNEERESKNKRALSTIAGWGDGGARGSSMGVPAGVAAEWVVGLHTFDPADDYRLHAGGANGDSDDATVSASGAHYGAGDNKDTNENEPLPEPPYGATWVVGKEDYSPAHAAEMSVRPGQLYAMWDTDDPAWVMLRDAAGTSFGGEVPTDCVAPAPESIPTRGSGRRIASGARKTVPVGVGLCYQLVAAHGSGSDSPTNESGGFARAGAGKGDDSWTRVRLPDGAEGMVPGWAVGAVDEEHAAALRLLADAERLFDAASLGDKAKAVEGVPFKYVIDRATRYSSRPSAGVDEGTMSTTSAAAARDAVDAESGSPTLADGMGPDCGSGSEVGAVDSDGLHAELERVKLAREEAERQLVELGALLEESRAAESDLRLKLEAAVIKAQLAQRDAVSAAERAQAAEEDVAVARRELSIMAASSSPAMSSSSRRTPSSSRRLSRRRYRAVEGAAAAAAEAAAAAKVAATAARPSSSATSVSA